MGRARRGGPTKATAVTSINPVAGVPPARSNIPGTAAQHRRPIRSPEVDRHPFLPPRGREPKGSNIIHLQGRSVRQAEREPLFPEDAFQPVGSGLSRKPSQLHQPSLVPALKVGELIAPGVHTARPNPEAVSLVGPLHESEVLSLALWGTPTDLGLKVPPPPGEGSNDMYQLTNRPRWRHHDAQKGVVTNRDDLSAEHLGPKRDPSSAENGLQ